MKIKDIRDLELFLNQNNVFDFFGVSTMGVFGFFRNFAREDLSLYRLDKYYKFVDFSRLK